MAARGLSRAVFTARPSPAAWPPARGIDRVSGSARWRSCCRRRVLRPNRAGGSQEPAAGPVVVAVAADVVRPVPSGRTTSRRCRGTSGARDRGRRCRPRQDPRLPRCAVSVPHARRATVESPATPRSERPASLRSPLATGARGSTRPPLRLSDRALQALVDSAWSRRERWRPFAPIAALIEAHDADQGRAADLVQALQRSEPAAAVLRQRDTRCPLLGDARTCRGPHRVHRAGWSVYEGKPGEQGVYRIALSARRTRAGQS